MTIENKILFDFELFFCNFGKIRLNLHIYNKKNQANNKYDRITRKYAM